MNRHQNRNWVIEIWEKDQSFINLESKNHMIRPAKPYKQTNKQKPIIKILLQNQNPDKKKPIAYPASNRNSQLLFSQHREQNQ